MVSHGSHIRPQIPHKGADESAWAQSSDPGGQGKRLVGPQGENRPGRAENRVEFRQRHPRDILERLGAVGWRGAAEIPILTLRVGADHDQILALDQALTDLARIQPRQAMMVETRFFGGLDVAETARLLHVSEATVLRDWRAARAWLARELRSS